MKAINKGFLEKVFPLEKVKFAFTLKHIDKYKHYYSVTFHSFDTLTHSYIEPFQKSILDGPGAIGERCQGISLDQLPDE